MKAKNSLIVLMYIGVGLLACSQGTIPASIETATVKPLSSTAIPITPTYTALSSCVSVVKQPSQNLPAQGNIILSGAPYYSGAPLFTPSYLLDLSSGEKIILPQEKNKVIVDSSFSISPNRERLEYVQENADRNEKFDKILYIVTADGVENTTIPIEINQRGFHWLDNNYLLIENLRDDWTSTSGARATLWLFNPFTGEKRELFSDYPDQFVVDNLLWEFSLSRVIYNSTLTRVIYPTVVNYSPVIRLVDVQTNQFLVDIPTTDFGKFPAWSSDGKRMAFATQTNKQADRDSYQDEIFILSEEGELIQLTQLSNANNYSYITGLSWSADNHQIAFWVNNTDWEKDHTGVHLSVVDTYTKEVYEYCDFGNSDGMIYIPKGNPIWSPDGKYLLVNLQDPSDDRHILVILVEISTGNTFQVGENYQAVGWLK